MICGNCFSEIRTKGVCPRCGFDMAAAEARYPFALKAGSILNGRYIVGRVLGQGGFGITYIALDDRRKTRVAVKEYFPTDFVSRIMGSSTVMPYPGEREESFLFGKTKFREEAEALSAFRNDGHIVRVLSYFEENDTAYFAMEYVEGEPLDKYVKNRGGRLLREEADELLLPLMESMERVHGKGLIHRDIAPDNIIVQPDGKARLIDFGAARYSTGEQSKSLDVVIKHGFAPYEQYMRHGRQGPFTDVYAMAATYYFAVTGRVTPDAVERNNADSLIPPRTVGAKLPEHTEAALLKALSLKAEDRFRTMGEFREAMAGPTSAAAAETGERKATPPVPEPPTAPSPPQGKKLLPAVIIAAAILLAAVALIVVLKPRTAPPPETAATPTPAADAAGPAAEEEGAAASVPEVKTSPNRSLPTVGPGFLRTPEPDEGEPEEEEPTPEPAEQPSAPPTEQPTAAPTAAPTAVPTATPTAEPPRSTPEPTPAPAAAPGPEDMNGCDKRIAKPEASSWLSEYSTRYIDVYHDRVAYLCADPNKSGNANHIGTIKEKTEVVLIAAENGFGLIKKNDVCVGWVKLEFLVLEYTNANHK